MIKIMMTERMRLARTILVCHTTLIGVVALLLITDSLLIEEFTPLLTLLLPVTSIYAGTVFKYLGDKIKSSDETQIETPLPHYGIVKWLIIGHFLIMLLLIVSKGIFNWVEFSIMITLLTLVETTFGAYMGSINNAIFTQKENQKN